MDAYDILRKQARAKRDAAIKAAQTECRETLRTIKALRARVLDEPIRNGAGVPIEPQGPKVIDVICQVMPDGLPFTAKQLLGWVQERMPGRELHRDTIRTLLHTLKNEGVVRRVARAGRNAVTWQYVKPRTNDLAFHAMLIPDAAAVVLAEAGPLKIAELVMTLQGRGYRADASPKTMMAAARAALRRNPERFACGKDRRWGVA